MVGAIDNAVSPARFSGVTVAALERSARPQRAKSSFQAALPFTDTNSTNQHGIRGAARCCVCRISQREIRHRGRQADKAPGRGSTRISFGPDQAGFLPQSIAQTPALRLKRWASFRSRQFPARPPCPAPSSFGAGAHGSCPDASGGASP